MAPPGVDKLAESCPLNVRFVRITRAAPRKRVRRQGPLLPLVILVVTLRLFAQAPVGGGLPFRPLGTCASGGDVRWQSLAPAGDRDTLDRWCDSVGPSLVAAGHPLSEPARTLVLATWNVHVGNGDVERFLQSITSGPRVRTPYGVVLLLQEVLRISPDVPPRYPDRMRPPRGIRAHGERQDIAALTRRLGLHAVYIPSMRNGRLFTSDAREDRGNAILSTWPLDDVRALELPFGQQRHVAVTARIAAAGVPPLRVMSVHLDPSGHRTAEAAALAAYVRDLTPSDETLVIGGDLNTWFGRREQALHLLTNVIPEENCGHEKTNSWPWRLQAPLGWWRGRLDYLFSTLAADEMRACTTLPEQFGSDHRPVIMTIEVSDR